MREEELKLARDSFSSVRVYLAYPQELQAFLEQTSAESSGPDEFFEKVKRAISTETDVTRKTDKQIYLNELKRVIR